MNPLKKQIGGSHYKHFAIQPIEFSHQNQLSFIAGCVIKRLCRYNQPGGKGLQDIEKALHELDVLLDQHRKGFVHVVSNDLCIEPSRFCQLNGITGRAEKVIVNLTKYHHSETGNLKHLGDARQHCDALLQELLSDAGNS